ncbi:hypothetical protein ACU4GD_39800 [Cupriavidus basilensis]
MLRRHLGRRPRVNPISAFRTVFPRAPGPDDGAWEPGFRPMRRACCASWAPISSCWAATCAGW